jgi:SAM-dependent methyltransferase
MYRFGAPWEIGPREELVGLVDSGVLTPEALPPGRALDLGCGSGANSVFLAERGFEAIGVDFSRTALEKARLLAGERGVAGRARFVEGDLTATSIPGVEGPFDLLVDYGTLDDLRGDKRRAMAATAKRLARPGGKFLLWCFYAAREDLPLIIASAAPHGSPRRSRRARRAHCSPMPSTSNGSRSPTLAAARHAFS